MANGMKTACKRVELGLSRPLRASVGWDTQLLGGAGRACAMLLQLSVHGIKVSVRCGKRSSEVPTIIEKVAKLLPCKSATPDAWRTLG